MTTQTNGWIVQLSTGARWHVFVDAAALGDFVRDWAAGGPPAQPAPPAAAAPYADPSRAPGYWLTERNKPLPGPDPKPWRTGPGS